MVDAAAAAIIVESIHVKLVVYKSVSVSVCVSGTTVIGTLLLAIWPRPYDIR